MVDSNVERSAELLALIKRVVDDPSPGNDALIKSALDELEADKEAAPTRDLVLSLLYGVHYFFLRNDVALALSCAVKSNQLAAQLGDDELLNRALRYEGAIRIETGDLLRGVNCSLEALSVATRNADQIGLAGAWNNLGCVLAGASQVADAITCFQKSAEVAEGLGDRTEWIPYGNIAESAARSRTNLELGLSAGKKATELNRDPVDATERDNRANSEACLSRLLVYSGDLTGAEQHAMAARRFADSGVSDRAEVSAQLAEGLVDVASGLYETGKKTLIRAVEKARTCGLTVHLEALATCIYAFDFAGQPDAALEYLKEAIDLNSNVKKHEIAVYQRMLECGIEVYGGRDATTDTINEFVDLQLKIEARLQQLSNTCINAALAAGHDLNRVFRVAKLAGLFAAALGWDADRVRKCRFAARFADIGMIALPDFLLSKPDRLTVAEKELVNEHTRVGAELLAAANLKQLATSIEVARYHHESWNGSGPSGLSGEAIPVEARIVTLCDCFDAMTHSRPWRQSMEVRTASAEIARLVGIKFDPTLGVAFIDYINRVLVSRGDLVSLLGEDGSQDAYVNARTRISTIVDKHAH